ncbi:MAG: HAD family hydrolase [Sphingomonas sp.]|nr:MAG: HAD family hydrolase [Sphingomonas sp.]
MVVQGKPVRSVLISDVDNTLFDWVQIWHAAFSSMLEELLRLSGLDEATLLPEIRAVHQRAGTSEYAFLIGEVEALRPAAGDTPVLDFYAPAIEAYRTARQQALEFYPGVEQTLKALRQRGTLIVCYTESLAYYSQYRFRKLGLDHLVDYLYSPGDHDLPDGMSREDIRFHEAAHYELERTQHRFTPPGELKPNPDILSSILRDLGVRHDQAIYVGDSAHKDIWMAQRAGVLDAQALYGAAQHREAYALLRQVSHWSDDDVERERLLIGKDHVLPTYRLNGFADLLDIVEFTAFEGVPV